MASYSLTNAAREDLHRIWSYGLEMFGLLQAERYFRGFLSQFQQIADNPLLFPKVSHLHPEAHRCVYGSDSIYYRRIEEGRIEIMAIIGRQEVSYGIS